MDYTSICPKCQSHNPHITLLLIDNETNDKQMFIKCSNCKLEYIVYDYDHRIWYENSPFDAQKKA